MVLDYSRDMLWSELFQDREFHSLDEVKSVHPSWRLGLRLLLKWGWKFERGDGDEIRVLPEAPLEVPDEYSRQAIEDFIALDGSEEPPSPIGRAREMRLTARALNRTARAIQSPSPRVKVTGERQGVKSPVPEVEPIEESADLELGRGLSVEADFLTETAAIIARKGSGKSYFAMMMAEEMFRHSLPFVVLDPTGAWWGLRSGADGDPEKGLAIPVIGGEHGDLPLVEGEALAHQGAVIAEFAVAHYPQSLIVDLSLITPDEQHAFAAAFFGQLFLRSRRAVHLFVDEADEFCLSEDTEILAESGWRFHSDLRKGTKVVAYDLATDSCRIEAVRRVIRRHHSGEMVSLQTRSVDCLVTPDHRVVLRRSQRAKGRTKKYDWTFCQADRAPHQVELPGPRLLKGQHGLDISDDFLRIVGWLLTDGSLHNRKRGRSGRYFTLSQSINTTKMGRLLHREMSEVLSRFGVGSTFRTVKRRVINGREVKKIRVRSWYLGSNLSDKIYHWLPHPFLRKVDRRIPRTLIERCSPRQLELLFFSMLEGDGTSWDHRWKSISVGLGEGLADDFQEIATRIGISTTKGSIAPSFGRRQWRVYLRDRKSHYIRRPVRLKYDGLVWDVTVPSGAFVARRNGRVFVTGNCPQAPRTLSEQKVLSQLDRLVRRGRIKGVGLTLITQRSAVISKNVLTQVGALFLLRTVGPQDLKAIEEWIKRHHEREVVDGILKALPGLPRGVLYHVTGGSKKPSKHDVRRRNTWDSSRTPGVGEIMESPPLRAVDTSELEQFFAERAAQESEDADDEEADIEERRIRRKTEKEG